MFSGASIARRSIVRNLRSIPQQQQPCGVDLSLLRVSRWTSPATIDFDNSGRRAARTADMPFQNEVIKLEPGSYLVEFNENVQMPLDCMGSIFCRSTLWRSGNTIHAGVVDPGYEGPLGALLQVQNATGLVLCKNAKLAQIVVSQLDEEVEGYNGIYQSSTNCAGTDGGVESRGDGVVVAAHDSPLEPEIEVEDRQG